MSLGHRTTPHAQDGSLTAARALYADVARFLHARGWRREELGSGWWWRDGFEEATLGGALEQELDALKIDKRERVLGEPDGEYWRTEDGPDAQGRWETGPTPASTCDCFGLTGTIFHDPGCPNCTHTLKEVREMGWIPPGLAVDPRCYICGDPILQGKEFWTLDGNWWCHLHQPVWSRQ